MLLLFLFHASLVPFPASRYFVFCSHSPTSLVNTQLYIVQVFHAELYANENSCFRINVAGFCAWDALFFFLRPTRPSLLVYTRMYTCIIAVIVIGITHVRARASMETTGRGLSRERCILFARLHARAFNPRILPSQIFLKPLYVLLNLISVQVYLKILSFSPNFHSSSLKQ